MFITPVNQNRSFGNYTYNSIKTQSYSFLNSNLANKMSFDTISFTGKSAREEKIAALKKELDSAIKNKDYEAIFEHIGISVDTNKDGTYTISEYKQPDRENGICFADLGIDEAELTRNVKVILGNADYERSSLKTPGVNLRLIQGNANFSGSKIKSLGNVNTIGKNANFTNSKVQTLGSLKVIGGNAKFKNSELTGLSSLQTIGGGASFNGSKITELNNLRIIGGEADFGNSKITSLNKLQYIGSNANFENSSVKSLGKLQIINGNANFRNSCVEEAADLVTIKGKVLLTKSDYSRLYDILEYVNITGKLEVA